jgi:hypothetical protein
MARFLTVTGAYYAMGAAAYMFAGTAALDAVWRANDDYIWQHIPLVGLLTMTTSAIVMTPLSFIAARRGAKFGFVITAYLALCYIGYWAGVMGWQQYVSGSVANQIYGSLQWWLVYAAVNLPPSAIIYGLFLAYFGWRQERANPASRLW